MKDIKEEILKLLMTICKEYPELRVAQVIDNSLEIFELKDKDLYYISDIKLYNALDNFYKFLLANKQ